METINLIHWWLVPTLIVLIILGLLIRHDGEDDSMENDDWVALAVLSIIWPIGAIVLVVIMFDWAKEMWTGQKYRDI